MLDSVEKLLEIVIFEAFHPIWKSGKIVKNRINVFLNDI